MIALLEYEDQKDDEDRSRDRLSRIKGSLGTKTSLTKDDLFNMPSQKGGYDFLPETDDQDMDPILKARKRAKKEKNQLFVFFVSSAMINN